LTPFKIGGQPLLDFANQRRIGFDGDNPEALFQIELGIFAVVHSNVDDQVSLHGSNPEII
jgi:hypothetical protein